MNDSDRTDLLGGQLHGEGDLPANRHMTREEIIRKVTEGGGDDGEVKKALIIPVSGGGDANEKETAEALGIQPDSPAYQVLKTFCERKNATSVQARALMQRSVSLDTAQWSLLGKVCGMDAFLTSDVLKFALMLKRFGTTRLLMLHGFLALDGAGPGPMERFFISALPQSTPDTVGQEAYEAELREKSMTRAQMDLFYNICTRLPNITCSTALALLPKVRSLNDQYTLVLNTFLKKDAVFKDTPIGNQNITGLINLWQSLPEIRDAKVVKSLIKKISRQPDAKKKDFQFIALTFKAEAEKESAPGGKGLFAAARRIIK